MNPSLLGGHRNIVLRPRVAIAKTVSPPSLCLLLHREDIPRNRGSHLRAFGHSERLSPRGAVRRNELRPCAGVEHGGTEKFDLGLPRTSRRRVQVWQRLRPGAPIDDFAKWRFVVLLILRFPSIRHGFLDQFQAPFVRHALGQVLDFRR